MESANIVTIGPMAILLDARAHTVGNRCVVKNSFRSALRSHLFFTVVQRDYLLWICLLFRHAYQLCHIVSLWNTSTRLILKVTHCYIEVHAVKDNLFSIITLKYCKKNSSFFSTRTVSQILMGSSIFSGFVKVLWIAVLKSP